MRFPWVMNRGTVALSRATCLFLTNTPCNCGTIQLTAIFWTSATYIQKYAYVCAHTHTNTYKNAHAYVCAHTHTNTYKNAHAYVCAHTHTNTYKNAHAHCACTHMHVHAHTHTQSKRHRGKNIQQFNGTGQKQVNGVIDKAEGCMR